MRPILFQFRRIVLTDWLAGLNKSDRSQRDRERMGTVIRRDYKCANAPVNYPYG
jgi:hypothetical protein